MATPLTPTRNMAPRRNPPRRGNNLPNPKVLSATVSSHEPQLMSFGPQLLRVRLVHLRSPTPTPIMALDPRRKRKFTEATKLGSPPEE